MRKINRSFRWQRLLKSFKLKATPARVALLDALRAANKPLDAAGLLGKLGGRADRVTLYRNLETLEKTGLIKKLSFGKNRSFFEPGNLRHHHHLICTGCGKVRGVPGCSVAGQEKRLAARRDFIKIFNHSLEFFGLCRECAK